MEPHISRSTSTPFILRSFLSGVIKHFLANNGMLLAGGIAYYTLLSIIPALVLILLFLSTMIDQQQLLETLHHYLTMIAPASADSLLGQVRHVLQLPQLAGGVGIVSVLIFSGLAFRMLNDAMQVIFVHRHVDKKRHTLLTLAITLSLTSKYLEMSAEWSTYSLTASLTGIMPMLGAPISTSQKL